ncbi:Uncharacterised protein [Mycobacteroides abscessus subsp. massiliense]|nr:Uncharacterised protein [Mycobacteroides abscessus subsp. massiliense]
MQDHARREDNFGGRQQPSTGKRGLAHGAQPGCIVIEVGCAEKHLQIADHMGQEEEHQHGAG